MRAERYGPLAVFVIAGFFAAVTTRYAVFAAAISDASGYVSEASRWLGWNLFGIQAFAFWPAWPLDLTLPLGYRAGPIAGTDVFTYPPGLPLAMAAAMAGGGELAAHVVPPLCGGLLVWATSEMAARLAGTRARVLAASMMATSAIALAMAVQPMSDVPAAAWWMLSLVFAARRPPSAQLAAGLCTSMAILTRPNLVPLAVAPALLAFFAAAQGRGRRVGIFVLSAAPGVTVLLWLQDVLYGAPLATGHLGIGNLFAISYLRDNLSHYVKWYAESHTPAVSLAILAPMLSWSASRYIVGDEAPPRVIMWALVAAIVFVYGAYLFYFPFDDPAYLRFMLPGLGPLYALTAAVISRGLDRLRPTAGTLVFAIALLLTAGMQAKHSYDKHITESWKLTERVPIAGHYLNAALPPNAIVITFFHSGSIRYYTGRYILRPDVIAPEAFDETIARVERSGYVPYLLVDDQLERAPLMARFPNSTRLAGLDWPPRATIGRYAQVTLYDLADRDRYARGERWPTDVVR